MIAEVLQVKAKKRPVQIKLTVDDLDAMPDDGGKYELIEGEIFTDEGTLVSRVAHVNHQTILFNLSGAFFVYLRQNPIGKAIPEPGLILSPFDAVIPDLIFIRNETFINAVSDEGKLTAAPELAIEILSFGASDIRRDRRVKRKLYGENFVQEYWIVDWRFLNVEVYRLRENVLELERKFKLEDTIESPLLPGFALKVADVFRF